MNLITAARRILGRFTSEIDPVEQFKRDIDRKVNECGLDPTLPEVLNLKEKAEEYTEDRT